MNFLTNQKPETIFYYRLKQTDFNGKVSFSKTVEVHYIGKYSASIFPNPFSSNVVLAFDGEVKGNVQIGIEDVFGRNLFNHSIALEIPLTSIELNLSFLMEGIYLVRIFNGATTLRYKIIKS